MPQVLDLVRLTGAIFFRDDFHAPWAYWSPRTLEIEGAIPPGAGSLVMFHIVDRGSCWVALDDGVRHPLSAGDVVVLPYGDAHSFGSDEPAEAVPITSILPSTPWVEFPHLRYGGDGEDTHMVCGYLRGDAVLFDPVLRALATHRGTTDERTGRRLGPSQRRLRRRPRAAGATADPLLAEWRLNLASGLLRTTDLGVAEVATKVGYTSEEAFSRAFKRALGMAPAHWRLAV